MILRYIPVRSHSLGFIAAALALGVLTAFGPGASLDRTLSEALRMSLSPNVTGLVSVVGAPSFIALALVLAAAARTQWRSIVRALGMLVVVTALEVALKALLNHPPLGYPAGVYTTTAVGPWAIPLIGGFPSGHAARTALLLGYLAFATTGFARTALVSVAVAVAFVLVASGAHEVSDVVAGCVIGLVAGGLLVKWERLAAPVTVIIED